jgi:hypothetical protein
VLAFYLGRGFDADSTELLAARSCVFQTVFRNEGVGVAVPVRCRTRVHTTTIVKPKAQVDRERVVAALLEQVAEIDEGFHVAVRKHAVGDEDGAIGEVLAGRHLQVGV